MTTLSSRLYTRIARVFKRTGEMFEEGNAERRGINMAAVAIGLMFLEESEKFSYERFINEVGLTKESNNDGTDDNS